MMDDRSQHFFASRVLFLRLLSHLRCAEPDPVYPSSVGLPLVQIPSLASTVATPTCADDKPRIIRSALASRDEMVNLKVLRCSAIHAPFVPSKNKRSEFWITSPKRFAVWASGPFDAVHRSTLLILSIPQDSRASSGNNFSAS